MLLDQQFPPDDRVEKEALSLIGDGHDVHILSINHGSYAEQENYKGISVHRINYSKALHNKLSAAYLVLPFHKNRWMTSTKKILEQFKFDALHIHDLPLANVGTFFKKKYALKLICDQHEYFSNWIGHTAHYNTFAGKIIKALSPWKSYEKKHLAQADLVGTVEEPLRECYIKEVGIPANKVICIPNTPLKSIFNANNVNQQIVEKYKNEFIIFYAGVIDILRGVDVVIQSLPELKKHIPKIKFVLAGRFAFGCNPIKDAEKLGVSEHVEYVGYLDSTKELPSYIAASTICNHTPYTSSDEVNKTIATKIYQYMLMEKPIIVSQAKMMCDFVLDRKIGFAIDANNKQSYVDAVLSVFNKEKYAVEIPENCRKYHNIYNWEKTVQPLLKAYRNLI